MRSAPSLLARIVPLLIPAALAPAQPCPPHWQFQPDPNALPTSLSSFVTFDAGSGEQLYAGGDFEGTASVHGVGRWDGAAWTTLGSMNGSVNALAVFDDGTGPAVYAAGSFLSPALIAKWTGTQWVPLGTGLGRGAGTQNVVALAIFDDGRGPALYAGGNFGGAGDLPLSSLARWDGHNWTDVGGGVRLEGIGRGYVIGMSAYDDGSGPALFVGGYFHLAGDVFAQGIAKWDGRAWMPVGSGLSGTYTPSASDFAAFDDGSGPALCVAGSFTAAGGVPAGSIAKWNGTAWSAVGNGIGAGGPDGQPYGARRLTVFDGGSGPALYAGGFFTSFDGIPATSLARWDGHTWASIATIGGAQPFVAALAPFPMGGRTELAIGGRFITVDNLAVGGAATWTGTSWQLLGVVPGIRSASALRPFDDGHGELMYATGSFDRIDGSVAHGLARWEATHWTPVGEGLAAPLGSHASGAALEALRGGPRSSLVVAGAFSAAGGVPAQNIAAWDGLTWSPLADGIGPGSVAALAMFDGPDGPVLFATGSFQTAGGRPASNIAKWDGREWTPLGAGLDRSATALAIYDDGHGPGLFVTGAFTHAGGLAASHIARWDGNNWSPLGAGLAVGDSVRASLCTFDDRRGHGPRLYVGSFFQTAGGVRANNIAAWDGSTWSALGAGTDDPPQCMQVFDDGRGPALFIGGGFSRAGGLTVPGIARWDGLTWSALDTTIGGTVQTLATFPLHSGESPSLWFGGYLNRSPGGQNAPGVAQWVPCPCHPDINLDGRLSIADLLTFLALYAAGDPQSRADFNADGRITIADFTAFLAAFAAGC